MKKICLLLCLFLLSLSLKAQWIELGTGSNALNANNIISSICKDNYGNVYSAGWYTNTNGKYYVAKWNGNTWSELGSGTNTLNANGVIYSICTDRIGNIYAAGSFADSNGYCYVAKWNGTTWTKLGTGGNALNANSYINSICTDSAGNVYAAGLFSDNSTYNTGYKYVAKWDGTTWTKLGTGTNALNANSTIFSICLDDSGKVYAGGFFTDSNSKYYVAKWNGNFWEELGGGVSAAIPGVVNYYIWDICVDYSGNVYAAGFFQDGTDGYYVAKWNGSSWSELGTGTTALKAGGGILSICSDKLGNIYAGGQFTNTNNKFYLAKWDGNSWTDVGLDVNDYIYSVYVDDSNIIYAAGEFTDKNNNTYVAKYQNYNSYLLDTIYGSTTYYMIDQNYKFYVDSVAGVTYKWIIDGDTTGTGGSTTVYWSTSGFHTVTCTAYEGGSALSSYTLPIDAYTSPLAVVPGASSAAITVYPNPNNGTFTIESPFTNGTLSIYNSLGIPVQNIQLTDKQSIINLANTVPGIYYLVIESDKESYNQKIVIEH